MIYVLTYNIHIVGLTYELLMRIFVKKTNWNVSRWIIAQT